MARFMDPNYFEVAYFNEQVVLAGKSVGFEDPDVEYTRVGLEQTFTHRCSPPAAIIPVSAGPQLQAICSDANTCPLSQNANCSAYSNGGVLDYPAIANVTLLQGVPKENDTIGLSTASASASSASASASSAASGAAAYSFGSGILTAVIGGMASVLFMMLVL